MRWLGSLPARAVCVQSPVRPSPGPSLRAGASALGRPPRPTPLAALSPHPPHARLHALPVLRPLCSGETFLAGVGSAGVSAAPQAWEPLPPLTAAERPRKGLGTPPPPAQPSMARWRCFCSLLSPEEGTATPLPAVQLNLALKTPHIHWQHPAEAVVSCARSAVLSQALRGIQRDHMPHNVHEGTVPEPCPHSTHRSQETCSCLQTTYAQGC